MTNAKSFLSPLIFCLSVLLPVAVSALLILPAITPGSSEPGGERAESVAVSDAEGRDQKAG